MMKTFSSFGCASMSLNIGIHPFPTQQCISATGRCPPCVDYTGDLTTCHLHVTTVSSSATCRPLDAGASSSRRASEKLRASLGNPAIMLRAGAYTTWPGEGFISPMQR
jgi:hypothetical protein